MNFRLCSGRSWPALSWP